MNRRVPVAYLKGVVAMVEDQVDAIESLTDGGRPADYFSVIAERMGGAICPVHIYPGATDLATARQILQTAIAASDDTIGPVDRTKAN